MTKKIDTKKIKAKALKESKGFLGEFKAFILRGNVMDMAIGVIIGSAFASIVTALTNDFINPLINSIGGVEMGGSIHLPWTPEGSTGQYLLWGDFVTSVINFLIMAFVLFIMLKFVNKITSIGKKKEEIKPAEPSDEVKLLAEIRDELKKKK